jgi:hypothetical protein
VWFGLQKRSFNFYRTISKRMQAKFIWPCCTNLSDALGLLLIFEPTFVLYIHIQIVFSRYRSCHICLLSHASALSSLNLFWRTHLNILNVFQ